MGSYAVRFEDVSKRYPRGGPRYASFRHDLNRAVRWVLRQQRDDLPERGTQALEGVSFTVEEGDSFALVGPNGAGKTSALKLIARVSYPTGGRLVVRGRLGALIEVGAGVHPELTGRENIWLYGRILGMPKPVIRRRFDDIVEFAELGGVLDRQVKMFSSGMQLRLGFSIAAHLDPDVFVVDEALSVGDADFQAKCVERMGELVAEGRTLIFVSHDLSAVEAVCDNGVFLLDGRVEDRGSIHDVLSSYLSWVERKRERDGIEALDVRQSRHLELREATLHGADGRERYRFATGDELEIRLRFHAPRRIESPFFSIGINDGKPGQLIYLSMLRDGSQPSEIEGDTVVSCRLRGLPLLPQTYQLWCSVRTQDAYGRAFDWQQIGLLRVAEGPEFPGPLSTTAYVAGGPVHVDHTWKVDRA